MKKENLLKLQSLVSFTIYQNDGILERTYKQFTKSGKEKQKANKGKEEKLPYIADIDYLFVTSQKKINASSVSRTFLCKDSKNLTEPSKVIGKLIDSVFLYIASNPKAFNPSFPSQVRFNFVNDTFDTKDSFEASQSLFLRVQSLKKTAICLYEAFVLACMPINEFTGNVHTLDKDFYKRKNIVERGNALLTAKAQKQLAKVEILG